VAYNHHKNLPALLEHARPRAIKGNRLVLGVTTAMFKQKIEMDDKREALQSALYEVLGTALQVEVTVAGDVAERDHDVNERLAEDDVLAFGVNELGGQITDLDE